ncbi:MAG: phage major tail tube protein [Acidobacteriota bacterium]
MIANVLRNLNAFLDGRGYAGQVEELELPKLAVKTEEHRPGGYDAPVEIDQGMEKLEAAATLSGYDLDVLASWGLAPGKSIPWTFKGALVSEDGTVNQAVVTLRGPVKGVEPGTWKPGEKSTLKVTMAPRYYKLAIGGTTVHEIDVENLKRIVNGEDQLQAIRNAIGL